MSSESVFCLYFDEFCFHSDNNNILYSSQRKIKAVIRSHNEGHISVILSHETCTYTLLDIRPLSLNLHTLIANPELPGITWNNALSVKPKRKKLSNKNP